MEPVWFATPSFIFHAFYSTLQRDFVHAFNVVLQLIFIPDGFYCS